MRQLLLRCQTATSEHIPQAGPPKHGRKADELGRRALRRSPQLASSSILREAPKSASLMRPLLVTSRLAPCSKRDRPGGGNSLLISVQCLLGPDLWHGHPSESTASMQECVKPPFHH